MINLAGNKQADVEIRVELQRARLEIISADRTGHEVSTTIAGKLGAWMFWRAWYYWVAEAPEGKGIPIELARQLHADPIGKTDVRVGGHCGCPSPDEYGATYLDAAGRLLVREAEREQMEYFIKKGFVRADAMDGRAYAANPKTDAHHATVDSYHIDSEAGLRLFVDALRAQMEHT
jgi:hypothetical protein